MKMLSSEGKRDARTQQACEKELRKIISKESTPCPEPMVKPGVQPIQQTMEKKKIAEEMFECFESHGKAYKAPLWKPVTTHLSGPANLMKA